MRVNASERKDVPLRNLSDGPGSDRSLEMEIWENEKVSMLPVFKDISMGRVWAVGREGVFEMKTKIAAQVELQRERGYTEDFRIICCIQ